MIFIIVIIINLLASFTTFATNSPEADPKIQSALITLRNGEYKKAVEQHLPLLKNDKYGPRVKSYLHKNLGVAYVALSQFDRAQVHLDEAVRMAILAGDKLYEADAHHELGNLLMRYSSFAEALEQYENALSLYQQAGNRRGSSIANGSIGAVYENQGLITKAMDYYKKSLAIDVEIKDSLSLSGTYGNIAKLYNDMDSFTIAIQYLNKRLPIAYALGDNKGLVYTWREIGYSLLNMADYSGAVVAMDSMKVYVERSGLRRLRVEAHEYQAQAYSGMGNHQEAAQEVYQAYLLTDSLKSEMEELYVAQLGKLKAEKDALEGNSYELPAWLPVGTVILSAMIVVNIIFLGFSYWVARNRM